MSSLHGEFFPSRRSTRNATTIPIVREMHIPIASTRSLRTSKGFQITFSNNKIPTNQTMAPADIAAKYVFQVNL